MDKRSLSERDICSKFITPALQNAGWDLQTQIAEEKTLTDGRIIVRGKMVARGKQTRADYVLYQKPNIPIAVIEAKDNKHAISDGLQQALTYAEMLRVPFAFSSNGDGFVFHDRTGNSPELEQEIRGFCKQHMASYKTPRFIEFLEELPKTGQGKIDKRLLKEMGL